MEGLPHQLVAGIATGSIYASVALALVMIYQATHHVNFAQREMATFSTYIALTMIQSGLPYWAAFALAVAVSFAIGVAVERLLMRPVQHAPVLTHGGGFLGRGGAGGRRGGGGAGAPAPAAPRAAAAGPDAGGLVHRPAADRRQPDGLGLRLHDQGFPQPL